MKRIWGKTIIAALMLTLVVSMSAPAFAAGSGAKEKQDAQMSVQNGTDVSLQMVSTTFIDIYKPAKNATYYKGEKLSYKFDSWDTWDYYWSMPTAFISNDSTGKFYLTKDFPIVPEDGYRTCTGSYNTAKLPAGTYTFSVMNFAYKYRDSEEFTDLGNEPYADLSFKVRVLRAPTAVKATAGKKKVTITYKKAAGAKKYEIYRSLYKGKGYKKIATTTKVKYVDKKVKKGKKYYYKVKTVRTGKGLVKSKFSKIVRSGKVKR